MGTDKDPEHDDKTGSNPLRLGCPTEADLRRGFSLVYLSRTVSRVGGFGWIVGKRGRIDAVQRHFIFGTCAVSAQKRLLFSKMYSISIYVYDLVCRKRMEYVPVSFIQGKTDAGRARA